MSMKEQAKPTRQQVMDRSIFFPDGSKGYSLSAAHHNVRDCVRAAGAETLEFVDGYYAGRGMAIGIPDSIRTRTGLFVATSDREVRDAARGQVNHIDGLSSHPIELFNEQNIQAAKNDGKVLVVPYLNTSEEEAYLQSLDVEIFGLPGVMTDALKNKASAHQMVTEYVNETKLTDFNVVEGYKIINVNETIKEAKTFLTEIEDQYKTIGLHEEYERKNAIGVVLRAAESDGGYGSCVVFRENDQYVATWDGVEGGRKTFPTYEDALIAAQMYLKGTMNESLEDNVVMSRMIDKVDSPGLSVMIADDHVISLGWNNQTDAYSCQGTSNYSPPDEYDEYCRGIQHAFEKQTVDEYEKFLRWVAKKKGIDFAKIRAFTNVDYMIPSELEFEQQKRTRQLQGKEPHPILPIAEFNPRLTDYTDAVVGGPLFYGGLQTPQMMLDLVAKGLTTYLKYHLPDGVDPLAVRDAVEKMNGERTDDGLVVVRMAPKAFEKPAISFVIYGNKAEGDIFIKQAVALAQNGKVVGI